MPTPPIVSVIIPVYNVEKYVAAAVESVMSQCLQDWELLVVDDGSTDSTPDELARFQSDPRLTVIRQANQGLAATRNRGLAAARGEFVAFLDADDLWDPDYLRQMVETLRRSPAAVAVFAGWQYMDDAGAVLPQAVRISPEQAGRLHDDLVWRNALVPSGAVARRQAVEACGGFDTQFSSCADWDLWLRLRRFGKLVAVVSTLVWYRTHGENMSDNVPAMERERLALHRKQLGPLDDAPARWPAPKRQAVANTLFISALAYFGRRDTARGIEKINGALACWPALIEQEEFYYELGCAYQQRGFRGTPVGLNLAESGALLRSLLLTHLEAQGGHLRRLACWGRACLALCQLALVADDRRLARGYAFGALALGPLRQKPAAGRALIHASLPVQWTQAIRNLRMKVAPASGSAP